MMHSSMIMNAPAVSLPRHASYSWRSDPKRFMFSLARYKWVAQMLAGLGVLEIGCADGFSSQIVAQSAGHLTAIDLDDGFLRGALANAHESPILFRHHDMLSGPFPN